MTIQAIVRDLRGIGLSDAEIAAQIGCAVSSISMWANGKRAVRTGETMLKLFRLHQDKCRATGEPAGQAADREAA